MFISKYQQSVCHKVAQCLIFTLVIKSFVFICISYWIEKVITSDVVQKYCRITPGLLPNRIRSDSRKICVTRQFVQWF